MSNCFKRWLAFSLWLLSLHLGFLQEEVDRLEAWVRVKSRKSFSEGRQHPVLQNGDGADVESGSE